MLHPRLTAAPVIFFSTMLALQVSAPAQKLAVPRIDPPPAGFATQELLWPTGAPEAAGRESVDQPRLFCYPAPDSGPHPAVVVLPGGGYIHLVNEKEGAAEARWLNTRGVSAYILQYRLSPRYMYPAAMQDGLRAIRFVRAHAAEWHVRPQAIGVWGFSAGGHLAGYLASAAPTAYPVKSGAPAPARDAIDRESAHPDFAILSYARLTLDPAVRGTFGMKVITGPNPSKAKLDALSPILHVTAHSSPSFLYATERDEKVNSENATLFFNALQRAGVPAELHVFEFGPHGTGMGQDIAAAPELAVWPLLLEHWMQAHGWMAAAGERSAAPAPAAR